LLVFLTYTDKCAANSAPAIPIGNYATSLLCPCTKHVAFWQLNVRITTTIRSQTPQTKSGTKVQIGKCS